MRTTLKVIGILVLAFGLSACSGSGGGGGSGNGALNGGDTSCQGADCTRDGDENLPPEQPTQSTDEPTDGPDVKPTPVPPLACGGGVACPDGYHCVTDPAANCDTATGVDCSGICVLGPDLPGCGGLDAEACPEGQTCVDDPADDCDGGPAVDCPGVCRPSAGGECTDDADCPVLVLPCPICADGSTSCPKSACIDGKCSLDFKPCSEAQPCGGISGLTCAPGFECVDDPADDCVDGEGSADCPGICVPEMQPSGCGGVAGITCPPGFECVDIPGDDCDPNANGADCPSVCEPTRGEKCTSDEECPSLRLPCSVCVDGSEACPTSVCQDGVCNVSFPSCPFPPGCASDADCPPGLACEIGANGCDPAAGIECGGGVCVPIDPTRECGGIVGDTCPPGFACVSSPDDECDPNQGGSDCKGTCLPTPPPPCNCASIQAPCNLCPDGTFSCPQPECLNGVCVVYFDACREPDFCGGIAGFPCPPGLTCIDDPNDDCDPNNGGADCSGICIREENPLACGGFDGAGCPDGFECVDVPDECDPNNGGADCPGFCRPVPGDRCASDTDCVVIGAPCQMCADGTAACPRSSCVNGECKAEFPSCADPQK